MLQLQMKKARENKNYFLTGRGKKKAWLSFRWPPVKKSSR